MKLKLAKIIRILTVAPVAAMLLCTLLWRFGAVFADGMRFGMAVLFLTGMPLLAYPVSFAVSRWRSREIQRKIAIAFAVFGYVAGTAFALCTPSLLGEKVLYLTYLLSGILTAVFSALGKKSSGHACGVAGPIAMLTYAISPMFLLLLGILAPVYWSSLQLKRHTLRQLISGSLVPVVSMLLAIFIAK